MALVSLPVDIVANGGPDWSVDGPALVSFKGYGDSSKGLPAVLFRGYGNSSKGLQLSFSGVKAIAAKAFQQSFSGVIITAKSYSCPFQGLRRQKQSLTAVLFRGYGDCSQGWEFALCFFCANPHFFSAKERFALFKEHRSFLKSKKSERTNSQP